MPPRIEARDLVVTRQGRAILAEASLAVARSAIATLEGASGSGKSTFLRALATLAPRDGGRILLDGVDAETLAPVTYRRRVGYVPQQPPMLDGTVGDNVATGPRLAGHRMDRATVEALLERVGLPRGFEERAARDLSGGERQRVALARALANEPLVLLLDEPTAALDPEAARRVLDLTVSLAESGLAVIVVTHVGDHAQRLGGARYECREGRIAPLETRDA